MSVDVLQRGSLYFVYIDSDGQPLRITGKGEPNGFAKPYTRLDDVKAAYGSDIQVISAKITQKVSHIFRDAEGKDLPETTAVVRELDGGGQHFTAAPVPSTPVIAPPSSVFEKPNAPPNESIPIEIELLDKLRDIVKRYEIMVEVGAKKPILKAEKEKVKIILDFAMDISDVAAGRYSELYEELK